MGASNSTNIPEEKVYKLCLKCIRDGHRNENIEVLNVTNYFDPKHDNTRTYLPADWQYAEHTLMCNRGHIFAYKSNSKEHRQAVTEYFEKRHTDTNLKEENEKLKKEIESLKKEIDELKQFAPSAPSIPIAEAIVSTSSVHVKL